MPKKKPQLKIKDNRIIRAVTIPVGAPANVEWAALKVALKDCWKQATDAANWCIMELFRRDTPNVAATPDCVKMGSVNAGRFYAYGEASKLPWFADWAGGKQSLNIVLQYAHREYLRRRFDVMVRHIQSLLTVRYPYPYPLDADAWSLSYADGDFPLITCALPGIGKVDLRLKRRADFGRQLGMLKQIHDGLAKKGEAALYQNSKGDLLVKVVGKFPRREISKEQFVHACILRTDPTRLLVAEIDGRSPWFVNGDQMRTWQSQHRSFLQRTSEDLKREKRMTHEQRDNLSKHREERCQKHRDRLATGIHQITAQVVRFCERAKVRTIAYDDSCKEFIPEGFPWHMLKEKLRYKLDEMGVEFHFNEPERGV